VNAPRTMYLHTIDGQPANFDDRRGARLYFAGGYGKSGAASLVPTLAQIRREQARVVAEDERNPIRRNPPPFRYGYVRVVVPGKAGAS